MQGHVYIAHSERAGYVKVGVSNSPQRRKWGLKRAGFGIVKMLWISPHLPDANAAETIVKRRLAKRRVLGHEWFDARPEAVINTARKAVRKVLRAAGNERPWWYRAPSA